MVKALLFAALILLAEGPQVCGQGPVQTPAAFCDDERALYLIEQQVGELKAEKRRAISIPIILRAADLMWKYDERKARNTFDSAYALAVKDFDEPAAKSGATTDPEQEFLDQRFTVIRAITIHDPAWATQLARNLADDLKQKSDSSHNDGNSLDAGEKMVESAYSLVGVNQGVAVSLVRTSFRFPAGLSLSNFLFKVAGTDRSGADQLYLEAMKSYGHATIEDLIYLSPYPFALNRLAGPVHRGFAYYEVPDRFSINSALEQSFLQTLLGLVEDKLNGSSDSPAHSVEKPTELEQIYSILSFLEPRTLARQPDFLERLLVLKGKAGALLSEESRKRAQDSAQEQTDTSNQAGADAGAPFEEELERVEKLPAAGRDVALVKLVMRTAAKENAKKLVAAAGKIQDTNVQDQLLNWLYFVLARKAIAAGLFDDAMQFAENERELEFRALLSAEIAEAILKRDDDRPRASEVLEKAFQFSLKGSETEVKAKALLTIAYLFAAFDSTRAKEIMREAIKTINRLNEPNLSSPTLIRQVGTSGYRAFVSYDVPGLTLEASFRELGTRDFEGALWLSQLLEDKSLRSTATIALAQRCLDAAKPNRKPVVSRRKPSN